MRFSRRNLIWNVGTLVAIVIVTAIAVHIAN